MRGMLFMYIKRMRGYKMKIIIPTKGRAGAVTTLKLFPTASLLVEPQEQNKYRIAYPGVEILLLDENDQGIGYARNWVLDNNDGRVLMLDDDLIKIFKAECQGKYRRCEPMEIVSAIEDLMGEGIALVGIAYVASAWMKVKRYSFNTGRIWCVTGLNIDLLREKKIRYDREVDLFEDFDYQAQVISKGLNTGVDNLYSFECVPMATNDGGLSGIRTNTKSYEAATRFVKKWFWCSKLEYKKNRGQMEVGIAWKKIRRNVG